MLRPPFTPSVCRPAARPEGSALSAPSDELLEVLRFAESAMRSAIELLDTTRCGDLERGGDLAWVLGRIRKQRRELESGLWIGRTVSALGDDDVRDAEPRDDVASARRVGVE